VHRAGPPGRGELEAGGDQVGDLVERRRLHRPLAEGREQPGVVTVLQNVAVDVPPVGLCREHQQRDGVSLGVGDRSDQVRGAGPRSAGQDDAGLARGQRVARCHVPGPLLVAGRDHPGRAGTAQFVIRGQEVPAGDREHGADAGSIDRFRDEAAS